MALARTLSVSLAGVSGRLIEVEADISAGLPGLTFTGLADVSVLESRERIRAAVLNSGLDWPNRRVTVALLPADLRKYGSVFDLALAVAVLAAAGEVPPAAVAGLAWLGELGLDGRLRPIRGVLPAVLAARAAGVRTVVVPAANAGEAALVTGLAVRVAHSLAEVVAALRPSGAQLAPALPVTGAPQPQLARPRRGGRPAGGPARAGDRRRRRPPPAAGGRAGRRQDHARRAAALDPAAAEYRARRWRSPRSTRWPECCRRAPACCAGRRCRRRTTPPRWRRWSAAAAGWVVPELPRWRIAECWSWTRRPSSGPPCWTRCASRWSPGRIVLHRTGGAVRIPGPVPAGAWRPIRARAVPGGTPTAAAPRMPGGGTGAGCPVRCWTGSTCGCRSTRCRGPN